MIGKCWEQTVLMEKRGSIGNNNGLKKIQNSEVQVLTFANFHDVTEHRFGKRYINALDYVIFLPFR